MLDSDPGDEGLDMEITVKPSDSQIQYDPPGAWSENWWIMHEWNKDQHAIGREDHV